MLKATPHLVGQQRRRPRRGTYTLQRGLGTKNNSSEIATVCFSHCFVGPFGEVEPPLAHLEARGDGGLHKADQPDSS